MCEPAWIETCVDRRDDRRTRERLITKQDHRTQVHPNRPHPGSSAEKLLQTTGGRLARMSRIEQQIWDMLEGYLTAEGIELDDVEVGGGGSARLCRITLDAEGGIDSDRLSQISPAISKLLDESDLFASSYMLEISSPGLERKLRRPSHFAKSVGREVMVKTVDREVHRGVLGAVNGDRFTITTDDGDVDLPYSDVTSAKTVFRWEGA